MMRGSELSKNGQNLENQSQIQILKTGKMRAVSSSVNNGRYTENDDEYGDIDLIAADIGNG